GVGVARRALEGLEGEALLAPRRGDADPPLVVDVPARSGTRERAVHPPRDTSEDEREDGRDHEERRAEPEVMLFERPPGGERHRRVDGDEQREHHHDGEEARPGAVERDRPEEAAVEIAARELDLEGERELAHPPKTSAASFDASLPSMAAPCAALMACMSLPMSFLPLSPWAAARAWMASRASGSPMAFGR